MLNVIGVLLVAALLQIAMSRLVRHRGLRRGGIVHHLLPVDGLHLKLHFKQIEFLLLPDHLDSLLSLAFNFLSR